MGLLFKRPEEGIRHSSAHRVANRDGAADLDRVCRPIANNWNGDLWPGSQIVVAAPAVKTLCEQRTIPQDPAFNPAIRSIHWHYDLGVDEVNLANRRGEGACRMVVYAAFVEYLVAERDYCGRIRDRLVHAVLVGEEAGFGSASTG